MKKTEKLLLFNYLIVFCIISCSIYTICHSQQQKVNINSLEIMNLQQMGSIRGGDCGGGYPGWCIYMDLNCPIGYCTSLWGGQCLSAQGAGPCDENHPFFKCACDSQWYYPIKECTNY